MKEIERDGQVYSFRILNSGIMFFSANLKRGRYLLGSADNCDIYIEHSSVLPIHCVVEIKNERVTLYNLEVGRPVIVNGEHGNVFSLKPNDVVKIGLITLDFDAAIVEVMPTNPFKKHRQDSIALRDKQIHEKEDISIPYIVYPFNKDYNFDTSEYIFEDNEKVFPIFKYKSEKQSVEITILFKRRIFSIDFLSADKGTYYLTGKKRNDSELEYLYLPPTDKIPIIESKNNEFFVHSLDFYEKRVFSDDKSKGNQRVFNLEPQEIVQFTKGDLSILVRNVESPPKVKAAPFFSRDKSLLKAYLFALLLLLIPLYLLNKVEVDKDDLEKDKAPQRIATILYKPKVKVWSKKVKRQKTKEQPREKENKTVKKQVPQTKKTKQDTPKKVAKKTPPKKVQKGAPPKKVTPKKVTQKSKSSANKRKSPTKSVTASPVPKAKGRVDVYKNNKFTSTISNLMAKGGKFQAIKTKGVTSGDDSFVGVKGVSGSTNIKTSRISDKIGNFDGSKKGVQDFSSSAKGLTGTKTFYTAGIPSQTVILGAMDPDLIRKILREHLPQFRFCYQKELDRTAKKIEGVVKFNFVIGASGTVNKAGISRSNNIPTSVKGCVLNVLRGIKFPRPRGGGVVEVSQPINFYPKTI